MTMYNDHIKSLGLGKPPGVVTVENIQAWQVSHPSTVRLRP